MLQGLKYFRSGTCCLSDQINHFPLAIAIRFDVALGRLEWRMPNHHLYVSERPTDGWYLLWCLGYESPATTMWWAAYKPKQLVPSLKHIHDGLSWGGVRPFGSEDKRCLSFKILKLMMLFEKVNQVFLQIFVQWNYPTTFAFWWWIREMKVIPYRAIRVHHHRPF